MPSLVRTRRLACLLVLAGSLGAVPAGADSLSNLPDPGYSELGPGALSGSIRARIDRITYPTIGFPSILVGGDRLQVCFRMPVHSTPGFSVVLRRTVGEVRNEIPLKVESATHESSWGGYRLLSRLPSGAATGMYDILVRSQGAGLADEQPNAVRVRTSIPDRFRFIHLADSQQSDPRGVLNPSPLNAGHFGTEEILRQELEEIRFLDPVFSVLSGDLLTGMDYDVEYAMAHEMWSKAGFPVFMVPGNHDGYASTAPHRYKFVRTRTRDGLEFWRKTFGPLHYSFDVGPYHFVALNSFGGDAGRRDSIYLAAMNHGGQIDRAQLDWLEQDLAGADASGRKSVIFMHHSPLGIPGRAGGPYTPNRPFDVDKAGDEFVDFLLHYATTGRYRNLGQVWNDEASATRLLSILDRHRVSHVLVGHSHSDRVRTRGDLTIIETTTMSSAGQYWGYRLFEADANGIRPVDYEAPKRQSIPAGNLLFTGSGRGDDRAEIRVASGLSQAYDGVLEFSLNWSDAGYDVEGGRIVETIRAGDRAIVRVEVRAEAGRSFSDRSRRDVEVRRRRPAPPAPPSGPGCSPGSGGTASNGSGASMAAFAIWFVFLPLLYGAVARRNADRRRG